MNNQQNINVLANRAKTAGVTSPAEFKQFLWGQLQQACELNEMLTYFATENVDTQLEELGRGKLSVESQAVLAGAIAWRRKQFRVVIAGSRTMNEGGYIVEAMSQSTFKPTLIVSGDARGADKLGEDWARHNNVAVKQFIPDWNGVGRSAGFKRNEAMAYYADALVAVWDGASHGTKHMIKYMYTIQKKPVYVYRTDLGRGELVTSTRSEIYCTAEEWPTVSKLAAMAAKKIQEERERWDLYANDPNDDLVNQPGEQLSLFA